MSDSLSSVLNMNRLDVALTPFPHVLVDEFFKPEVFRQLHDGFPNIAKMDRPKGWGQSLYWGEVEYERHLEENPSWKQVFDVVHSQSFIDYMIDQFGEHWEREGCAIDLPRARYVPYCEDRIDKERGQLRRVEHEPHELWCRLDFYQSWEGYYRPLHLDHRRRLISMLVYFTNQEEIEMQGGELILHSPGVDLFLLEKLGLYHAPKAFSMAVAPTSSGPLKFSAGVIVVPSPASV